MKIKNLTGLTLLTMAVPATSLLAADASPSTKELLQRIKTLEQQVQTMQNEQDNDRKTMDQMVQHAPVLTAGEKGFSFRSADTNFVIKIKGLAQVDSRNFFDDGGVSGNNGFLLRRLRPIIAGTVYHNFNFVFAPDLGGGKAKIQDAYINYACCPELQLKVGRFKSPVGLEYLQSCVNIEFNERSLATDLVPFRDLGVELHGALLGGRLDYAVGVFNGLADESNESGSDSNDGKDVIGRLFTHPLKKSSVPALHGLGFGVGGSYSHESVLPSAYKTEGQQKFFTYNSGVVGAGDHWRIAPQGSYYYGPFGLFGEYIISSQRVSSGASKATLNHHAWDVTGSWVLTGEKKSYKGISPAKPFNPLEGGWGAWELAARYTELTLDPDTFPTFANLSTSANEAKAWSLGLSWWLNKNVRVMTSFSHTTFSGGTAGPATKQPENVLFTRVQLAF